MKKVFVLCFLFSSVFINSTFGQTAQKIVLNVEKQMHEEFPDYQKMEDELLHAKNLDPKELDVDYYLALVMLEQSGKSEALPYVKNVMDNEKSYLRDFDFYRAYLEHRNENFNQAIIYYNLFKSKLTSSDNKVALILSATNYLINNIKSRHPNSFVEISDLNSLIDNRIKQCENGKKLLNSKINVKITNLGYEVNSSFDDYSPVYSSIDSTLYFTSRRPIPNHLKKDDGDELYLEHIFEVDHKSGNGIWSKAKFEDEPLNSFTHNVSALAVNNAGNDIFIFDYRNNGDIMHSIKKSDGSWSIPKIFSESFISSRPERSFAISNDGKLVVLERDGQKDNNRDLFYSTFDGQKWTNPKTMGNIINTEFYEDAVFLHNNGKVLYFSSKGHNSMGGYDVFKSTFNSNDSSWTRPENLGYPINTVHDDIYFIISADESFGYVSSNRPGGNGGFDNYHINFKPNPVLQEISIKLIDKENGSYINDANLVLVDLLSKNQFPMKQMPDGTYQANIENQDYHTKYKIICKKDKFVPEEISFEIADNEIKTSVKPLYLQQIKQQVIDFIFNDVYLFDLNSSEFFNKYNDRLNVLISSLKEYNVKILIEGHTDNTASSKYNMNLSEKRAIEVQQYLIKNGVNKDQIIYQGFGESKPLNDNSTKELRNLNRRVTVSLVK